MKHKWIKSDEPITEQDKLTCVIAKDICTVCKCERTTQRFFNKNYNHPEFSYLYFRNQMHYSEYVSCVNINDNNEIDAEEINEIMGLTT